MADEVLGTARIDVIVGTDQMDVTIERAKSRLSSMSSEAQKAYASLNAAEKKRIDSLIKQADTIGFTREQQILYNAALKGAPVAILDELKAKMGGVKASTEQAAAAATKGFSGTGKSARELQFAMRGLPAQFTDIFTSLASGQRPMMVLLQQGGQIKDMFGGVGPALRAMGSGILAMINPLTIGVAAAAALAFAWKEGSDEAAAYNKALITTGNYAGVTADRMGEMAKSISGAVGTQHEAAKALAEVAASGKFTGEQIQLVGKAALDMSRMTGQATSETIKQFESLQEKPLEAILKLNDAQHFLTTAIYEQIKALEDQGRTQEAADLATKTYADTIDRRKDQVIQNLGSIERAWNAVKTAAERAGDAALKVGRQSVGDEKLLGLQGEANAAAIAYDNLLKNPPMSEWYSRNLQDKAYYATWLADAKKRSEDATKAYHDEEHKQEADRAEAAKRSVAAQATQALIDSDAEAAIYATREEKRVKEVLAAHNKANAEVEKALAAGDKASAERIRANEAKIVAGIEAKYADKTPTASRAKSPRDFRVQDMAQIRAEIEAEGKLMDQRQRGEAVVAAYKATLDDMLQTRQAQIDLQVASVGMGQHEIDQMTARIAVDKDYNRKHAELQKGLQSTSNAQAQQWYADQLAKLDSYYAERVKMEEDGAKRAEAARMSFSAGASSALKDFIYKAGDVAGQTYDVFTNAFDGAADSLANFVTKGKGNFSDLIESFIADMVKMEARILASQLLTSLFGGMGTAAGYNSASPSQQVAFDVAHGSANGNVFNSPNLSAYSNTIVDKPTFFAKGGNVMGEAGPEAIMPLRRGPDGRLGVAASGGTGDMQVVVNITNNGQPVQAQQTGQRMDGKKMMIDLVLDAVAGDMAKGGRTATAAQQRFGLSRRGVPVGG